MILSNSKAVRAKGHMDECHRDSQPNILKCILNNTTTDLWSAAHLVSSVLGSGNPSPSPGGTGIQYHSLTGHMKLEITLHF